MIHYSNRQTLADELAKLVAEQLNNTLTLNDKASLALSGGTTPSPFIKQLANLPITWQNVNVTTTDERWVSLDHERSNARMVMNIMTDTRAKDCNFQPLYIEDQTQSDALPLLEIQMTEKFTPLDVIVLGMGNDGHTASLFPGADNLKAAMDRENPAHLSPICAPGASEPRISLTLAKILSARHIHLLISGTDKLETLNKARQNNNPEIMPVCALLNLKNLSIHYSD